MTPTDRLLERAAAGHDIREEAARLVAAKKAAKSARSRRVKPRKAPRLAQKRAAREERNARTAEVRAVVVARADGDCECCGNPGSEMHHLVSGPSRRHRESVETCAFLCRTCHCMWHDNHFDVLFSLGRWALDHGYHEARRECERRMDKMARAAVPASRRDAAPTENHDHE